MRFHVAVLGGLAAVSLGASGCTTETEPAEHVYCEAGALVFGEDFVVDYGDFDLVVNQPVSFRGQCGPDLRRYSRETLAAVDGVLFLDCEISWKDGGRSTASDHGIDCKETPLEEQDNWPSPP